MCPCKASRSNQYGFARGADILSYLSLIYRGADLSLANRPGFPPRPDLNLPITSIVMLVVAVASQLAALSGPVCTRPALHAPVVSRAARRVVCAEAEAESNTNADEGRDSGVRGARIIGFAGGAVAGRCAKLKFLPKLSLLSCTHCCTQRRVGGRPREQRRPVGAYLSGAPARSPHATAPA